MKKITDNDIIVISILLRSDTNNKELLISSEMASLIITYVREYFQINNIECYIENSSILKDLIIYHSFDHKKFYYALTRNKTIEKLNDEYYDKMFTDLNNAISYAFEMIEKLIKENHGYQRNLVK